MLTTDELLNEAISLPVELRAQLVDALLRSLNPTQAEIDEWWAGEAERRIAELDAGEAELIPGEEVFARLYQSIRNTRSDHPDPRGHAVEP
jgi:putative addiction module component (TIGR02574 family)